MAYAWSVVLTIAALPGAPRSGSPQIVQRIGSEDRTTSVAGFGGVDTVHAQQFAALRFTELHG